MLVQDYHLSLLPGVLAEKRPDLHTVHFTHTPFASPDTLAGAALGGGPRGPRGHGGRDRVRVPHGALGGSASAAAATTWASTPHHTFVSPLTPDSDHLIERAASASAQAAGERLEELLRGRRMVLRVDRIEPAKNLLRGLLGLRRDAAHAARAARRGRAAGPRLRVALDPARVPRLRGRGRAGGAPRVNDTWGTDDWAPIILDVADDPGRSIAALMRYDVLLVNPLRDGLNLVAKEGPIVNTTDGVLALSREAGAFAELHAEALEINPFDVARHGRGAPPGPRHGPGGTGPAGRGAAAWSRAQTRGLARRSAGRRWLPG